tara:strand:+ start:246 stop:446 length:201 start_codon:yes stop_codon:yes gene_type:complete
MVLGAGLIPKEAVKLLERQGLVDRGTSEVADVQVMTEEALGDFVQHLESMIDQRGYELQRRLLEEE